MICSSKYNRKMYRAVSPKPRLFCFVLIAVFHRLRTNSSRPGTRKTVVIFRPASSASEGTRVLTRKVGTTLTLPGLFFFFYYGRNKQNQRFNVVLRWQQELCRAPGIQIYYWDVNIVGFFSQKNIPSHVAVRRKKKNWWKRSQVGVNCHVIEEKKALQIFGQSTP